MLGGTFGASAPADFVGKRPAEEVGGKVMDVWVSAITKVLLSNAYAFSDVGLCERASKDDGWRDVPIAHTFDDSEVGEGTVGQVTGDSVEAIDIPCWWKE